MEEKIIRPFYHMHPLVLKEKKAMSGTKRVESCYGCRKPVADSEMAYVCTEVDDDDDDDDCSDMILHKKCGELPSKIDQHPKHPRHPIHLVDYHGRRGYWCNVCWRDLEDVLGYQCVSCDVDIDITCEKIGIDAFSEERRKELLHPSHPSHPLTLIRKPPFPFYCDGCGAEGADMAYICSTCEVMLHKCCAALPATVRTDQHHHRLALAFSFPEKHLKFKYKCDVCDKLLDLTCWVYYCDDCRYFVHIKCVIAVGSSTSNFPDTSNLNGESDGDVIEFPLHANDICERLITPFVMTQTSSLGHISEDAKDHTATNSSFLLEYFHEHPLDLVSELTHKEEDEEEEESEESKICDACVTPISNSTPYYECATSTCTYSIHSICSLLPRTLQYTSSSTSLLLKLYGECNQIPNKNHNFTLFTSKGRDVISPRQCGLCSLRTNGMVYKCGDCEKTIDVKCASLPTTIRHASHTRRHHKPLTLTRMSLAASTKKRCHVCDYDSFTRAYNMGYCCSDDGCDFALHLVCAGLPSTVVSHELDKHPLLLTSDASLDHPSDFFCEFCEIEMHPKKWMYHCRHCDASFHFRCLDTAGSGAFRNMKFGKRYEFEGIHPNHPLTFTCVTLKKHCDLCHKREHVYTRFGFECATCYYVVCWKCGFEEYRKKNQMSLC